MIPVTVLTSGVSGVSAMLVLSSENDRVPRVSGERVRATGQLGLGDVIDRHSPVQLLAPAGYKYTSIDADLFHAIATVAVVPEPASLAAFALAGAALRRRRRP